MKLIYVLNKNNFLEFIILEMINIILLIFLFKKNSYQTLPDTLKYLKVHAFCLLPIDMQNNLNAVLS